jgi:hypothetical protein
MTTKLLLLDSTNVVTLSRLKDEVTDDYLDDATATLDLFDANGAPVAGAQGIAMSFDAGATPSAGKYRGEIPASVALTDGADYDARVTAVATDGSQRVFHLACTAAKG